MKKWTVVDEAVTPDGKTISLHEHDGAYSIRIDAAELMSTRQHASEDRLAELPAGAARAQEKELELAQREKRSKLIEGHFP